jgi:hypothetical protein
MARAYTPTEAIAAATADSVRQPGSELGASCTLKLDGVCTEGIHTEQACVAGHGVFRRAPCAVDNAIGSCRMKDGAVIVAELDNGRGYDATDLRAMCADPDLPGTWTDGPRISEATRRRAPKLERSAGSCRRTDGVCRDYSVEDVSAPQATCDGTWSDFPCPLERLAGTCRWADGMTERFYAQVGAKKLAARQAAWAKKCERADPFVAALGTLGRGQWIASP